MSYNPEFRRCGACYAERMCFWYLGLWLCKGPSRCWTRRRTLHGIKVLNAAKKEASA